MPNNDRGLGLLELTALVAGNMIGSGIFLLPSNLATIGTVSLFSWVFSAGGAMLLAYVFIRLNQFISKAGGPYAYVHYSLGRFLGFQTAYLYWIAVWVGNAAIALACVSYASVFWPSLTHPVTACIASILLVWLLTGLNCMSIYMAGQVQWITTVLKLIPMILVCLGGWFFVRTHYYVDYFNVTIPRSSTTHAISIGTTLTFWAFIGLESATIPVATARYPKRDIPIATIVGTIITAIVYILSSTVIMGMIPAPQLQHDTAPFATAAQIIFGSWGGYLIAAGAMIACLGCLNGWILLQGQVAMSAADDGMFPKLFAKRNRKRIPYIGLIVSSVLISILLLFTLSYTLVKQFEYLILLAVLATFIPYFYTMISACVLAYREKSFFTSWIFIVILLIAVGYTTWIIANVGYQVLNGGCLLLLSSILFYAFIIADCPGNKKVL